MNVYLPKNDEINWIKDNTNRYFLNFDIGNLEELIPFNFLLHENLNNSTFLHIYTDIEPVTKEIKSIGITLYYDNLPMSIETTKSIIENTIKHFNKLDNDFSYSDMNEYIKDQVQQYQFAKELLERTGFDEDEIRELEYHTQFEVEKNNLLITTPMELIGRKGFVEFKEGEPYSTNYDLELRIKIFKDDYDNNYGLKIFTEDYNNTDWNNGLVLIGRENNGEELDILTYEKIPELKLNDNFYFDIQKDFENYTNEIINKGDLSHISYKPNNINNYIGDQNINKQIKTDNDSWFDTFPDNKNLDYGLLQDISDFIIDECSKEDYSFEETETALIHRYIASEKGRTHIDAWVNSGKLKEFYDDLNTPTINTNNNRTNNLNPKELEKMGYVQGVAECVAALGDNHELGKKMLNEMKVTKEDILKYANPKTVNFLTQEDNILASKPEQKLEQTQGRGR